MSSVAAYTLDEWCERWRVCRTTAYQLHKDGKLKIRKLGRKPIVTVDEDRRFAEKELPDFTPMHGGSHHAELGRRSAEKRRQRKARAGQAQPRVEAAE